MSTQNIQKATGIQKTIRFTQLFIDIKVKKFIVNITSFKMKHTNFIFTVYRY